jgi:putative hydrolase of HD superfamily
MKTLENILLIFKLAGRLKQERRRGWIEKVGIGVPESVADHTFRTVLISMVMSDLRGLDTCRIMRMALIHDLAEAITGDVISKATRDRLMVDNESMNKIIQYIPEPVRQMYKAIWVEWLTAGTTEARMVHEIDKLEMAIQASEYRSEGYPDEKLEEFRRSAFNRIEDKDLLELFHMSAES